MYGGTVRIVLDSNVLVSALLKLHSPPARVLELIRNGAITLCVDSRILDEYEEVLLRPEFPFSREDVTSLIEFFRQNGELVSPKLLPDHLPDRDDEPFLEVALSGTVDALVTGNIRHFPEECRAGVQVLSPAQMIETIRAAEARLREREEE